MVFVGAQSNTYQVIATFHDFSFVDSHILIPMSLKQLGKHLLECFMLPHPLGMRLIRLLAGGREIKINDGSGKRFYLVHGFALRWK
jgi:hypothetical protein